MTSYVIWPFRPLIAREMTQWLSKHITYSSPHLYLNRWLITFVPTGSLGIKQRQKENLERTNTSVPSPQLTLSPVKVLEIEHRGMKGLLLKKKQISQQFYLKSYTGCDTQCVTARLPNQTIVMGVFLIFSLFFSLPSISHQGTHLATISIKYQTETFTFTWTDKSNTHTNMYTHTHTHTHAYTHIYTNTPKEHMRKWIYRI